MRYEVVYGCPNSGHRAKKKLLFPSPSPSPFPISQVRRAEEGNLDNKEDGEGQSVGASKRGSAGRGEGERAKQSRVFRVTSTGARQRKGKKVGATSWRGRGTGPGQASIGAEGAAATANAAEKRWDITYHIFLPFFSFLAFPKPVRKAGASQGSLVTRRPCPGTDLVKVRYWRGGRFAAAACSRRPHLLPTTPPQPQAPHPTHTVVRA